MKLQVLKNGCTVEVDQVGNVYCPTGQGGGVDPTCKRGGKGGKSTSGGKREKGAGKDSRGKNEMSLSELKDKEPGLAKHISRYYVKKRGEPDRIKMAQNLLGDYDVAEIHFKDGAVIDLIRTIDPQVWMGGVRKQKGYGRDNWVGSSGLGRPS